MIRSIRIRPEQRRTLVGPVNRHDTLGRVPVLAGSGHGRTPVLLPQPPAQGPIPGSGTTAPELAGADALGWGYDVFGAFADPISCTRPLLKFPETYRDVRTADGSVYRLHSDVSYMALSKGMVRVVAGMTFDEYRTSQQTEVNLGIQAGLFGGEVEMDFSYESLTRRESAFSSVRDLFEYYRLTLEAPLSKLAEYLDPVVIDDAKTLGPAAFFDRYGTHVLTRLVMGASCLYASSTLAAAFADRQSLALAARAAYAGISAQASTTMTSERQHFEQYSETTVIVAGGDPRYSHDIGTAGNYDRWLASINSNNVEFVDFLPGSLVPVWSLLGPKLPTEAAKLAQAFPAYAAGRQLHIAQTLEAVRDILVISGENREIQPPSSDYIKIPVDLNRHAHGKFVFLCYRTTRDTSQQIVDVAVLDSGSKKLTSPPPPFVGWQMDSHDLNEGAGGDYIYVLTRRGGGTPVTGLAVVAEEHSQAAAPRGYVRIDQDLNKGAGGDYIYLCFSRVPGIRQV